MENVENLNIQVDESRERRVLLAKTSERFRLNIVKIVLHRIISVVDLTYPLAGFVQPEASMMR